MPWGLFFARFWRKKLNFTEFFLKHRKNTKKRAKSAERMIPQTTFVLTFRPYIISELGGVGQLPKNTYEIL